MIVVCESCTQKYRINDSKLPPGGGNIKCPSCGHVFFVKPPTPELQALPSMPDHGGGYDDDGATMVGSIPSMLLGNQPSSAGLDAFSSLPSLPDQGGPSFEDDGSTFVGKPSMLMQQALAAGAGGDSTPKWKLKTNFGLVFDFPDAERMREWLANRDTLEGYQATRDGVNFVPLDQIPELMTDDIKSKLDQPSNTPQPPTTTNPPPVSLGGAPPVSLGGTPPTPLSSTTPAPLGGGTPPAPLGGSPPSLSSTTPAPLGGSPPSLSGTPSPLGANTAPGLSTTPARPRPRPRPRPQASQEKSSSNTWIAVVAALLAIFGLFVVLESAGITNFRKKPATTPPPVTNTPPATENTEGTENFEANQELEDDTTPEEVAAAPPSANPLSFRGNVTSMIQQAEKEMRSGEYENAVQTLNSAKGLDPNNAQIYRLLEQAYSRTGDRDAARDAAAKRRELERAP